MKLTYYDTSHHNVAILIFHGGDLVSLITFKGTILYQSVSCFSGKRLPLVFQSVMYLYCKNVRGKYEWKNERKCVVNKLLFLIIFNYTSVKTNCSHILGKHKCQSSRLCYLSFTGWYWISNEENIFIYILYKFHQVFNKSFRHFYYYRLELRQLWQECLALTLP